MNVFDRGLFSERFAFKDWPNPQIPRVSAGVYAIWDASQLIYCGMSGRDIERSIAQNKTKAGLVTRLHSHASGRLSGDQFCVYVANRLVIPTIESHQLDQFRSGALTLDQLTKAYIHTHFDYQYALCETSREAFSLEHRARSGECFGQRPLLNPLQQ